MSVKLINEASFKKVENVVSFILSQDGLALSKIQKVKLEKHITRVFEFVMGDNLILIDKISRLTRQLDDLKQTDTKLKSPGDRLLEKQRNSNFTENKFQEVNKKITDQIKQNVQYLNKNSDSNEEDEKSEMQNSVLTKNILSRGVESPKAKEMVTPTTKKL